MADEALFDIHCAACQWRAIWGAREMEQRLREDGHLRRAERPPLELVRELLTGLAPRWECPDCSVAGLRVTPWLEEDDWATARRCEICRQAIPPERLEALPDAVRCVDCQHEAETGKLQAEVEFCPRCGALLELRVSRRGGLTRYRLFCTGQPPCRV